MKPPRHFIANIASRYFTSVALNAHMPSGNGALVAAICSCNCAIHTDVIHAAFANRKGNCRRVLAESYYSHNCRYGYREMAAEHSRGAVQPCPKGDECVYC